MKKSDLSKSVRWALGSLAAAGFVLATALTAAPLARARGGGGGVPSPFVAASNHKVELADGELYTLEGKIVVDSSGALFFNVDLRKHPWLANTKRVENPYYPLQASVSQWQQYEGKTILLVATAHGVVNDGDYVITLEPVNSNPARSIVK